MMSYCKNNAQKTIVYSLALILALSCGPIKTAAAIAAKEQLAIQDDTSQTVKEMTPLMEAVQSGNYGKARSLLDASIDDINWIHHRKGPALYMAACNGNQAMIQLLIDRGANLKSKSDKWSVFLGAFYCNQSISVKTLFSKGALVPDELLYFSNFYFYYHNDAALELIEHAYKHGMIEEMKASIRKQSSAEKSGPPLSVEQKKTREHGIEEIYKFLDEKVAEIVERDFVAELGQSLTELTNE